MLVVGSTGVTGVLGRNVIPRLIECGRAVQAWIHRTTFMEILDQCSLQNADKGCKAMP